jgi:hypothetical protein
MDDEQAKQKMRDGFVEDVMEKCGGNAKLAEIMIFLMVHPESPCYVPPKEITEKALLVLEENLKLINQMFRSKTTGTA